MRAVGLDAVLLRQFLLADDAHLEEIARPDRRARASRGGRLRGGGAPEEHANDDCDVENPREAMHYGDSVARAPRARSSHMNQRNAEERFEAAVGHVVEAAAGVRSEATCC